MSLLTRVLTAIAVALGCGWAMFKGVQLTLFLAAESRAEAENTPTPMTTWSTALGVGGVARNRVAEMLFSGADARAGVAATADSLAHAPLDAGAWLRLAKLRMATEKQFEAGVVALKMSNIVGPNEGAMMASRAALALPLWRRLPPESRRLAINDLIGGWPSMAPTEQVDLKDLLAEQNAAIRAEIGQALLLGGEAGQMVSAALDLNAAAPAGAAAPEVAPSRPVPGAAMPSIPKTAAPPRLRREDATGAN